MSSSTPRFHRLTVNDLRRESADAVSLTFTIPAALADAMGSLLRDSERARQMGIRGRARVLAAFQMSTVVQRHEQVYEACLAHAYGG